MPAQALKRKALPPPHYTNVLQAQLLSGRGKPRVWFAEQDGRQCVVKGPISEKERDGCLKTQQFKELLGIRHTNMRCETTAEGDFLIQRSLIDYTTLERHTVSTSFEKNATVPVATHICPWQDTFLTTAPELSYPMLEALLFRKLVGAHDTCRWNIMVVDEYDDDLDANTLHLYSIDDDAMAGRTTPMMWKAKACPQMFGATLDQCWEQLNQTMDRWESVLQEQIQRHQDPLAQFALEQLAKHRNRSAWRWC
jgi:hypothetical protein